MRLFRLYIENSAIINQVWWGDATDPEMIEYRTRILNAFPDEVWPFEPNIFGVDEVNNVITIHQCTKPEGPMQNDIMFKADFNRYIYDIEHKVKTFELFYNEGNALPIVNVPSNLTIKYITDMFDSDFNNLNTQSLYVQGNVKDVYKWADKLNPNIPKPIKPSRLHDVDSFQFKFDSNGNLTNLLLFAHTNREMVRGYGKEVHVEYSVDYYDDLINSNVSAVVKAQYDNSGNRIASNVVKDDIREFVKIPVEGEAKKFAHRKLSDVLKERADKAKRLRRNINGVVESP